MGSEPDITDLLLAWRAGDRGAMDRVFPLVYEELRRIAHHQLERERPDHTLGTTAVVHEAYLKLVDQTRTQWADRGQFFAVAARAMRRILVDYARRHRALKRGGERARINLDDVPLAADVRSDVLIALDEALERLAGEEALVGEVVKLRYFAGLTIEQTATALGISVRTANRHWAYARAWLQKKLKGHSSPEGRRT